MALTARKAESGKRGWKSEGETRAVTEQQRESVEINPGAIIGECNGAEIRVQQREDGKKIRKL
jgi:hypothetical protein